MLQFEINPKFKELIPPLSDEEFSQLEKNILDEGIRDPLVVWGNTLVDGHNRYRIAQKHGLTFDVLCRDFDNEDQVKVWMIDNQKGRRNLTDGWRWQLAQVKAEILREKGREKMSEARSEAWEAKKEGLSIIDKPMPEPTHNTRYEIAADLGWSSGKVAMAEQVWKKADDEVRQKVLDGDLTISGAYKEVKRQEQQERRQQLSSSLSAADVQTEKKYRVIYADPPWKYGNDFTKAMPGSTRPEDHYMTMDLAEICAMPIREMCEENAVLFLWATSPLLPEALEVIKAWGFKYKTSFVWDKIKHNFGHYNSVRHEFLFIATRGSCTPDNLKLFDSVQSVERTEHSAKPEVFREIIDTLYTYGNKIELFCRTPKEGWDVHGNQIEAA